MLLKISEYSQQPVDKALDELEENEAARILYVLFSFAKRKNENHYFISDFPEISLSFFISMYKTIKIINHWAFSDLRLFVNRKILNKVNDPDFFIDSLLFAPEPQNSISLCLAFLSESNLKMAPNSSSIDKLFNLINAKAHYFNSQQSCLLLQSLARLAQYKFLTLQKLSLEKFAILLYQGKQELSTQGLLKILAHFELQDSSIETVFDQLIEELSRKLPYEEEILSVIPALSWKPEWQNKIASLAFSYSLKPKCSYYGQEHQLFLQRLNNINDVCLNFKSLLNDSQITDLVTSHLNDVTSFFQLLRILILFDHKRLNLFTNLLTNPFFTQKITCISCKEFKLLMDLKGADFGKNILIKTLFAQEEKLASPMDVQIQGIQKYYSESVKQSPYLAAYQAFKSQGYRPSQLHWKALPQTPPQSVVQGLSSKS